MPFHVFTFLTLGLSLYLIPAAPGMTEDMRHIIIEVHDLQALAEQAHDRKLPILLMLSQDDCPYCSIMEENYLRPLLRSGQYQDKVIIRKIEIDNDRILTDFDGKQLKARELQSRYHSSVTPTLIFLNSDGKEIAAKLVGIGTEGFFAGDIDNAIDVARMYLQSKMIK